MPPETNWIANIYHGVDSDIFVTNVPPHTNKPPAKPYLAYLGRIIEAKGVHLAIRAVLLYNEQNPNKKYTLKIAGKHYSGHGKDKYWQEVIEPLLKSPDIDYLGHLSNLRDKQEFLSEASALMIPSIFDEPFGMVTIEALACGTAVIGLDSGAIPEIIKHGITGFVVTKCFLPSDTNNPAKSALLDDETILHKLAEAIAQLENIDPKDCREDFEKRFTLERMVCGHLDAYNSVLD